MMGLKKLGGLSNYTTCCRELSPKGLAVGGEETLPHDAHLFNSSQNIKIDVSNKVRDIAITNVASVTNRHASLIYCIPVITLL